MSNTNVVIQTGRMGSDVKHAVMPSSQTSVADVSLAVKKHRYNSGSGEFDETTSWIPVKFFGDLADRARDKLSKGTLITIVGELSEETWVDKQSSKNRSKLVVIAHSFEKLAEGKNVTNMNEHQGNRPAAQPASAKQQQHQQTRPQAAAAPANY